MQPVPNDYVLIEAWWATPRDEKILHREFSDCRKRGEWFDLPEIQIKELYNYFAGKQPYSQSESRLVADVMAQMWLDNRRLQNDYDSKIRDLKCISDSLRKETAEQSEEIRELRELLGANGISATTARKSRLSLLPSLASLSNGNIRPDKF